MSGFVSLALADPATRHPLSRNSPVAFIGVNENQHSIMDSLFNVPLVWLLAES